METNLFDPRYEVQIKYRKISRTVNVEGAVTFGKGREYGRRQFPDFSNADHDRIVAEMETTIRSLEASYNETLDEAAWETWDRPFAFGDYRVSGIGSYEFSDDHKDQLRHLARSISRARSIQEMHLAAKRRTSKYHPAP